MRSILRDLVAGDSHQRPPQIAVMITGPARGSFAWVHAHVITYNILLDGPSNNGHVICHYIDPGEATSVAPTSGPRSRTLAMSLILLPIPSRDFDPSEVAVS